MATPYPASHTFKTHRHGYCSSPFFKKIIMNITLSETFPIVIITLLVELFKQFGLPKGWEKPCAFILALVFGGIFLWKKDWLEIVKGILLYALGAVGLYENSIKLVKTGLK